MKNVLVNPEVQALFLEQVRLHVAQDRIIQGDYGDSQESQKKFKGCFFGCAWNSMRTFDYRIGAIAPDDRKLLALAMGIPYEIALIAEAIFERLDEELAPSFFLAAAQVIVRANKVGADLSRVWPRMALEILAGGREGAMYHTDDLEARALIGKVAALYMRITQGDLPAAAEWTTAELALRDACLSHAPRSTNTINALFVGLHTVQAQRSPNEAAAAVMSVRWPEHTWRRDLFLGTMEEVCIGIEETVNHG